MITNSLVPIVLPVSSLIVVLVILFYTRREFRWWHYFKKHEMVDVKVTVPMFDSVSKGILIKCECGKTWAL